MLGNQLERPVVDATGLTGKYDISLFWVTEAVRPGTTASEIDSGPTLISALQEQLGLKLQSKKVAIDYPIIDHVDKTPTGN